MLSPMHCSVLQCVAVCCSVLQCAAVCCSVLQCAAVCCSVLQWAKGHIIAVTITDTHTDTHTHTCGVVSTAAGSFFPFYFVILPVTHFSEKCLTVCCFRVNGCQIFFVCVVFIVFWKLGVSRGSSIFQFCRSLFTFIGLFTCVCLFSHL